MFVVFDGMDGTGKSTQLNLFADWLTDAGQNVVRCKDPGTTGLGDRLREILLGHHEIPINMRSELLMFLTARAQLVDQFIRPALEQGKTVVCDRYVFSTVVYQGHAGGINPATVWELNRFATDGLMADLTFLFDLDPNIARARLGNSPDRLESRGIEYFQKLREGFAVESKRWPTGVEMIDASGSVAEIQSEIRRIATSWLAARA